MKEEIEKIKEDVIRIRKEKGEDAPFLPVCNPHYSCEICDQREREWEWLLGYKTNNLLRRLYERRNKKD